MSSELPETRDPFAELAQTLREARKSLDRLANLARSSGETAATFAPLLAEADESLRRLGSDRSISPAEIVVATPAELAFDVSDLLAYFPYNRAPTGIQRVQMEILLKLLGGADGERFRLVRFVPLTNRWVEVPAALFVTLAAASKAGGDPEDRYWLDLYSKVDGATANAAAIPFAKGAMLINLGSSWWLKNYFLQIRALEAEHGLRYVPLIYDVIPAVAPDMCAPELVGEFVEWFLGVLGHASHFLAISEATKRDFIALAAQAGRTIPEEAVKVVPLDADYRQPGGPPASPLGIGRPYVLQVSTFEIRKNQLGALDAWRELINRHGLEKTPQLVLVGKLGFHGHDVLQRIDRDEMLKQRVTVLKNVDDAVLGDLYGRALFTLYPSSYEGWGLPVTEALCYGKVPLIADNSSLPEAGGDFAVYFRSGSPAELLGALEKLIFDEAHRVRLEQRVRTEFRARNWRDVAGQVHDIVAEWQAETDSAAWPTYEVPEIRSGTFYPMGRGRSRQIWKGSGSGEVFREGGDWFEIEDWGVWSKPAGARLRMRVGGDAPLRIAVHMQGLPDLASSYRIEDGQGNVGRGRLHIGQLRWGIVDAQPRDGALTLTIALDESGYDKNTKRALGVGILGFFVMEPTAEAEAAFVEAVALGSLNDYSAFRRVA